MKEKTSIMIVEIWKTEREEESGLFTSPKEPSCGCPVYIKPTTGLNCDYCEHKPILHEDIDEPKQNQIGKQTKVRILHFEFSKHLLLN